MHILGPEMHIPKTMVASLGPFALPSGYFSNLSLSAGLADWHISSQEESLGRFFCDISPMLSRAAHQSK